MTPSIAVRTWRNRVFRVVVDYLSEHQGRWVDSYELAAHLYRDCEDGGPLWAHQAVHKAVRRNRKRLEQHGWRVVGRRKRGYRLEAT